MWKGKSLCCSENNKVRVARLYSNSVCGCDTCLIALQMLSSNVQAIQSHSRIGCSPTASSVSFKASRHYCSSVPVFSIYSNKAHTDHHKSVGVVYWYQEAPAVCKSICCCYRAAAVFKVYLGAWPEELAATDYIKEMNLQIIVG